MNIRTARTRLSPQDVSFGIAQLMPLIMRGIQLDFFVKQGVTQTQFLVLSSIRAYGHCSMGTLATNLHVRMPTATGVVERLVKAGYVRRVAGREDRRQVVVELTAKSQAFFRAFEAVVRRRWEEALRTLSREELAAFHDVITKLRDTLRPVR